MKWSLRRLEAADSRHVRSIARSPAHLSHESNAALRGRLKIQSPLQDLGCDNEASSGNGVLRMRPLCGIFRILASGSKTSLQTTAETDVDLPSANGRLRLCRPTEGVACTVCGVYFTCMRTMKTHRTKMHEAPEDCYPPLSPSLRVSIILNTPRDGMPHCLHCDRKVYAC